ncbi:hypothetical protein LJC11_01065 [Bacteroidales bacterium OttesenSCG-928-I21]|nr:hypothetical protein [Bacteroidales bacterium OttesenSCG-928-I21]
MEPIKRILQDKISNRTEPNKAILIFGARCVGKTRTTQDLFRETEERTV